MFSRSKITITVDEIPYENPTHILIEYSGRSIWLRRSRIKINSDTDGKIVITLSRRYFESKLQNRGS